MSHPSSDNALRPRPTLRVLFDYKIANAPGMSTIGVELTYPPGAWLPPHRHGGATVIGMVLEGQMLSGMNGNPPKVYQPGETWMELPGCHHTVCDNNSAEVTSKMVAMFTLETEVIEKGGYDVLTKMDPEWQHIEVEWR